LEFDEAGNFKLAFGTAGNGPGQFQLPSGIVVSNDSGRVYVSDALLNRVQVFDACGNLLPPYSSSSTQIGSTGTAPGFLYQPYGLATDSGFSFWVADTGNNRVQAFEQAGPFLFAFGTLGGGNGQFNAPTGVAISGNTLWVTDTGNSRVQEFTITFAQDGFTPTALTFVRKFGSLGNGNGYFNGPFGIVPAVDQSGDIWVADSLNQRVLQFSSTGTFINAITGFSYASPYGLALDAVGLWTVDYNTNTVTVFNPSTGAKILSFGNGPGLLFHPTYIAVGLISGYV
jgi:DNA-binding beta-propeller fold protein YncE